MADQDFEKIIHQTQQYAKTILDSLSAHVAIIDEKGVILETNQAWRNFASCNDVMVRPDMLNVNYLQICDAAKGQSSESSAKVAAGIRSVIRGDLDEFVIDYPCHSPQHQRWFYMRATRAVGEAPLRIVISHEDITALKIAQEQLLQSQQQLREKTLHLEEANTALRAVIRQNDERVEEMEAMLLENVRTVVLPNLQKIEERCNLPDISALVGKIEAGLHEITLPLLHRLSTLHTVLTPQELRVALCIREGKTTKEIAEQLYLSKATVNFHRQNLRKKLGLTNTSGNLRTQLLSLSK